jgi:Na+/H+ antiporter NhaA
MRVEIIRAVPNTDPVGQMLVRALIYRLVTHEIFHPGTSAGAGVTRAVDVACGLAAAT